MLGQRINQIIRQRGVEYKRKRGVIGSGRPDVVVRSGKGSRVPYGGRP